MMLIYEAINIVNGKVYAGLTTNTLEYRKSPHLRSAKSGSNSYFHKAIRKHGEECFEWHVILRTNHTEKLYDLEKMVIGLYEDWQTYNISSGGEHSAYGLRHSDDVKKLCGEYGKRRWDGKRATDKYPEWLFAPSTYREARVYGVPKTTWYRQKRKMKS